MNSPRRARRWERRGILSSFDHRVLLWIVGTGLGAFLLGYMFIALVFFPSREGGAVIAVPELRELNVPEATSQLNRMGLELEIGATLPNPEVPEGAILAQSPLPGTEVQPGSPIRVIVSAGRERRTIVDLEGMGQEQAERILDALGFQVVVDTVAARVPAGRVVQTDPAAGSTVPVPSPIRVTVSAGPPLAAVPDVVGLLEHDARQALDDLGFAVGSVEFEYRPEEFGTVTWQAPAPGDSLHLGEPVDLRVATDQWMQMDQRRDEDVNPVLRIDT